MEKVKISRELADTIEYFRTSNLSNIDIIQQKAGDKFSLGTNSKNNKVLTSIDFDTLMNILINGYEVEETPEDRVREMFQRERVNRIEGSLIAQYVQMGALEILEIYNIKIEGIN